MKIEAVKEEIRAKFPDSVLYQVLANEPDELSDDQLLNRLDLWMKLSKLKPSRESK